MDLRDTPEAAAFREEARTWLEENCPPELRDLAIPEASDRMLEERKEWERRLAEGNWIGVWWPEQYGGRGASLLEQIIFIEEYARAGAPPRLSYFGEGLLGPTLVVMGPEELRERFLPGIAGARDYWCQGFSEPDAGSDLASVKTRAVLDGDEWVITGQKIWTTMGHAADYMFLLARTDPEAPKHRGLSYLLMPMDQEGVEVRTIRQMTGEAEFNEIFLDEARAPRDWVVGEVNGGWKAALTTLSFERSTSFIPLTIRFEREFDRFVERLRKTTGLAVTENGRALHRLMRLYVRLRVMRFNNLRLITEILERGGAPGPQSSLSKVYWSEWHRDFGEAVVDLLGPYGELYRDERSPEGGEWQRTFLAARAETIYAGTSEIQRNIIGEHVLDLPREPREGAAAKGERRSV